MERLMSRDGLMVGETGDEIVLQKGPRRKLVITREDLRWLVFTAGPAALSWRDETVDGYTGSRVPPGTKPAAENVIPLDAA